MNTETILCICAAIIAASVLLNWALDTLAARRLRLKRERNHGLLNVRHSAWWLDGREVTVTEVEHYAVRYTATDTGKQFTRSRSGFEKNASPR